MKEEIMFQLKTMFEVMASEEFTKAVADFAWNMFQELKKRGFTDEQAIAIVISMNAKK